MKRQLVSVRLTVPLEDICYLSWNLDACEGLGFLQTDDAERGSVTVFTPEELLPELMDFIEGHRKENIEIKVNGIDGAWEVNNE